MAEAELRGLVQALAEELQAALWISRYGSHIDRIRGMAAPSEKLIYFYLMHSEPQNFTTIRRALKLSNSAVDESLKRLLSRGYVVLDKTYLYWVAPPQ